MGISEWVADALNEYFRAFSEGLGDFTTRDVEALTGPRVSLNPGVRA